MDGGGTLLVDLRDQRGLTIGGEKREPDHGDSRTLLVASLCSLQPGAAAPVVGLALEESFHLDFFESVTVLGVHDRHEAVVFDGVQGGFRPTANVQGMKRNSCPSVEAKIPFAAEAVSDNPWTMTRARRALAR